MWSHPISTNTLLFLLNRYVALLGNIVVLLSFSGLIRPTVRQQLTLELHSHLILSPSFAEVSLILNIVADMN